MLRLAPSHPPLWRTPSTVQLGTERARPLGVDPWQERLLDALVVGIPDGRLGPFARELGVGEDEVRDFVERIADALVPAPTPPPAVRVEMPADLPREDEAALVAGLEAGGVRIVETARWSLPEGPYPTVLVASRLVDPHRAARLVSADVVHLPVELSGDRVVVGPLVAPGLSACLACVHSTRRDHDAGWPLVAAQLLARPAVATDPLLLLEAAALTVRLLAAGETGRSAALSAAGVRRAWRAHRPHARCLCRSPEGTSTAAARDDRTSAPTTVSAFARPA